MDKKYITIINAIKTNIKNGTYKSGDILPTEQQFCNQFSVSRVTVQRAMKILSEEGVVSRTAGKGTFVNQGINQREESAFFHLILPNRNIELYALLKSIEEYISKQGYLFSVHILDDISNHDHQLNSAIKKILLLNPSGIICYPPNSKISDDVLEQINESGIPFILIDKELDCVTFDCVTSDNYGGMCELVQYVIDCGHKNITYISCDTSYGESIIKRKQAFFDCIAKNNIDTKNIFADFSLFDKEAMAPEIERILKEKPGSTVIICATDVIAEVCYSVLKKHSKRIPDDISICSFDGYEKSRYFVPSLTSSSQNLHDIGEIAARLLIRKYSCTDELDKKCKITYIVPTTLLKCDSVKKV